MEITPMSCPYFINKLITLSNNTFNKQLWYIRKKSTKVPGIVQVRKEEKILFGAIIKDEKERKSTESQNQNTLVQKEERLMETKNPELVWQIKHCNKYLKMHSGVLNTSKEVRAEQPMKLINTKDSGTNSKNTDSITYSKFGFPKDDISSPLEKTPQRQNPSRTVQKLPKIIINNITSFPIFSRREKKTNILPANDILALSAEDNPSSYEYPGVSKILRDTMSKEAQAALERWRKRMIECLGEEKFDLHVKNQLESGAAFHASIEKRLYGMMEEVPQIILPFYESMDSVFKNLHDVQAIETHVAHTKLSYKGIVDCVAFYKGQLCLIDWKKSDTKKFRVESTYDAPLQVAAYIGAINFSENYPFNIKAGLVVVANADGSPANVHRLEGEVLEKYWRKWLLRLQQYFVGIEK